MTTSRFERRLKGAPRGGAAAAAPPCCVFRPLPPAAAKAFLRLWSELSEQFPQGASESADFWRKLLEKRREKRISGTRQGVVWKPPMRYMIPSDN
jgi:hypothetical protein